MRRKNTKKYPKRRALLSTKTIFAILTLLALLGGVLIGSSLSDARHSQASVDHPVYKYYTSIEIGEGDTLWEIADTYMEEGNWNRQEYIAEIKRLNQIDENEIHSGQHLLIPYYSEKYL